MWNENEFPEWAAKEGGVNEFRYKIFQNWRMHHLTREEPQEGEEQVAHPMERFENWPYWMVLELCAVTFAAPMEYADLLTETENLLEAICDELDAKFSANESHVSQ